MASIITGTGLGLFNTSANLLGSSGNALVGRAGQSDGVYINSATGNVVIRSQDEFVSSIGLDTSLIRTYNSLGQMADDNGDNWQFNVSRLVSPVNTGTTVTKRFGDGAEVVYTYDAAKSSSSKRVYVSTAGDGADDTLTYIISGAGAAGAGRGHVAAVQGRSG